MRINVIAGKMPALGGTQRMRYPTRHSQGRERLQARCLHHKAETRCLHHKAEIVVQASSLHSTARSATKYPTQHSQGRERLQARCLHYKAEIEVQASSLHHKMMADSVDASRSWGPLPVVGGLVSPYHFLHATRDRIAEEP